MLVSLHNFSIIFVLLKFVTDYEMQTSLILQCTLSVEELKLLDEDGIATLLESLDGADPLLRMFTLEAIVDNKNRTKAVESLIKLLKDEESAVRAKVAWALGKIKDKRELFAMAQYVANIFQGYWSCDFLLGENGQWYFTESRDVIPNKNATSEPPTLPRPGPTLIPL